MFYYILWFFLHLFAFCFASRFFLHIPDTYPIHTRHIPDTYVYPTNTPWIPHEYPTNTPYLFLTYSKYRRMHTLKWKSAIFDTCQCPPNSLFLSLYLSLSIYMSLSMSIIPNVIRLHLAARKIIDCERVLSPLSFFSFPHRCAAFNFA